MIKAAKNGETDHHKWAETGVPLSLGIYPVYLLGTLASDVDVVDLTYLLRKTVTPKDAQNFNYRTKTKQQNLRKQLNPIYVLVYCAAFFWNAESFKNTREWV